MLLPSPCLEQGLTAPHLLQDRRDTSPPPGWKEHTATPQVQLAGGTGGFLLQLQEPTACHLRGCGQAREALGTGTLAQAALEPW